MSSEDSMPRFGGRTVEENLARAVATGKLVPHEGGWSLPAQAMSSPYLPVKWALPLECHFLNDFLFTHAYARSAVPFGCRNCFKVKIVPKTFRGLIALRTLLEAAPYHSKCGVDFHNPHSRDIYAGFLYLDGLAAAREAWQQMRPLVDAEPALGAATAMSIKRGCSNYEAACGPSDKWTFDDGAAEREAALKARFYSPPRPPPNYRVLRAAKMVGWMQIAYSIGDDTYLDFTGGRPLHPSMVAYPPVPTEGEKDSMPSTP